MALEITDVPVTHPLLETKRKPSQELGKNDFLLLLTKQLQYQDPMKPVENTEFVAQMAQFSSLEQMTNMNASLEKFANASNQSSQFQALGMLGNTVSAKNADMTEAITGTVDSMRFVDGEALFKVGEKEFQISEIQGVTWQ